MPDLLELQQILGKRAHALGEQLRVNIRNTRVSRQGVDVFPETRPCVGRRSVALPGVKKSFNGAKKSFNIDQRIACVHLPRQMLFYVIGRTTPARLALGRSRSICLAVARKAARSKGQVPPKYLQHIDHTRGANALFLRSIRSSRSCPQPAIRPWSKYGP
jgi:hypothetical protein